MNNLGRATAGWLQHSKIATVAGKVAQSMFAVGGARRGGIGDGRGGETRRQSNTKGISMRVGLL